MSRNAFTMKRIDREKAYSFEGACTTGAEEFFSCLRRKSATITESRASTSTDRGGMAQR
jgi:hypothetical protein